MSGHRLWWLAGLLLVSVYAFDPDRREVVVVWPATAGWLARVVAGLPPGVGAEQASGLCAALSRLSQALWDTYVRPACVAVDEEERTRREGERERFDVVVAAVREPNVPDESGLLVVSYIVVEESAHGLGRVLRRLADPAVAEGVVAEVRVELDAVVRAECGDLSGRAVQAVSMDRLDVSPVQVIAANEILRADPLGRTLLSAPVDPAAACVAAAHWLAASAVVAADAAGSAPGGVFAEADAIQAVSVRVPRLVVEKIEDHGVPPRVVVLDLLRVAVAAGRGEIADLRGVMAQRARLEESAQRLPADRREETRAASPLRASELDPRRAARDLLEHLLDGIASCQLLYGEYTDGLDDGLLPEDGDTADKASDVGDAQADAPHPARVAARFARLVREQATATAARLC